MARETEREPLQALEQKRAKKAWEQIEEIVRQGKDNLGENYRAIVRKAPAMVRTNGIGQTLAYLLAKEKKDARTLLTEPPEEAEGFLYKHLQEWLLDPEASIAWTKKEPQIEKIIQENSWTKKEPQTLIEKIIQENSVIYRQAMREALAYLGWLKRFAEACLQKGEG